MPLPDPWRPIRPQAPERSDLAWRMLVEMLRRLRQQGPPIASSLHPRMFDASEGVGAVQRPKVKGGGPSRTG